MACTFFGHSDCYGLDESVLKGAVEALIHKGINTFYVGNHGRFDSMVFRCLLTLEKAYPDISVAVVLAYLPTHNSAYDPYRGYSMYPPIEEGPPRFAIERRNQWMINHTTHCLTFVNHSYGGAYKFARRAKAKGLTVINLGNIEL